MPSRNRARLILVLALLVVNAYAAVLIWTFTLGPATTAHIDHCTTGRHKTCDGTWPDPGGGTAAGSISGVSPTDLNTEVPVRLGPLGAYRDTPDILTIWLLLPAALDAGLGFGAVLIVRLRRRMRADVGALLAEPGAALIVRTSGGRAHRPDRSVFLAPGPDGRMVDARGVPVFALDRTDHGGGEPSTYVLAPDGRLIGMIVRDHPATGTVRFTLYANGTSVATGTASGGGALRLLAPDGRLIGGLGWAGRDNWVLRLDVPLDEPARTLVLALALDIHRLTGIRAHGRSSVALGRGYGS